MSILSNVDIYPLFNDIRLCWCHWSQIKITLWKCDLKGALDHRGYKGTAAEEDIRLRVLFPSSAGYNNLTKLLPKEETQLGDCTVTNEQNTKNNTPAWPGGHGFVAFKISHCIIAILSWSHIGICAQILIPGSAASIYHCINSHLIFPLHQSLLPTPCMTDSNAFGNGVICKP